MNPPTWDAIGFMTILYYLARTGKNARQTDTQPTMPGWEPIRERYFIEDYLQRWENRDWTNAALFLITLLRKNGESY
ncbi:MAG: hypothetical protein R3293_14315 [Candidatus Promineifilaceae bacterium]|nr:hypothetical protein [Candidatus Promineifilaceae bacterium]